MASSALLALLSVALCLSTASAAIWGGATSINQYAPAIIRSYGHNFPAYASVGSGAGITGFLQGTYPIAASDDPLNNQQNTAAGGTKKITVPLTFSLYAVATKRASGLRLTAKQLAQIYRGAITKWSTIKRGLTGSIVPVARADGSGTTELFGIWMNKAVGSYWTLTTTASWQGHTGVAKTTKYFTGSNGVAGYTASNKYALCYVQAGIGITLFKLKAFGLVNPAGNSVLPTSVTDPTQSLPRSTPPSSSSWAAVSLLNKPGAKTYPVASFVYMFARKYYSKKSLATTVKAFLLFTQGPTAQNLASQYFFYRLPSSILKKGAAAAKTIT